MFAVDCLKGVLSSWSLLTAAAATSSSSTTTTSSSSCIGSGPSLLAISEQVIPPVRVLSASDKDESLPPDVVVVVATTSPMELKPLPHETSHCTLVPLWTSPPPSSCSPACPSASSLGTERETGRGGPILSSVVLVRAVLADTQDPLPPQGQQQQGQQQSVLSSCAVSWSDCCPQSLCIALVAEALVLLNARVLSVRPSGQSNRLLLNCQDRLLVLDCLPLSLGRPLQPLGTVGEALRTWTNVVSPSSPCDGVSLAWWSPTANTDICTDTNIDNTASTATTDIVNANTNTFAAAITCQFGLYGEFYGFPRHKRLVCAAFLPVLSPTSSSSSLSKEMVLLSLLEQVDRLTPTSELVLWNVDAQRRVANNRVSVHFQLTPSVSLLRSTLQPVELVIQPRPVTSDGYGDIISSYGNGNRNGIKTMGTVMALDSDRRLWFSVNLFFSRFPGPMFPAGYTLIQQVQSYVELEDEFDLLPVEQQQLVTSTDPVS
jgi:hypothetical protein